MRSSMKTLASAPLFHKSGLGLDDGRRCRAVAVGIEKRSASIIQS
jgi:hypothetical protein